MKDLNSEGSWDLSVQETKLSKCEKTSGLSHNWLQLTIQMHKLNIVKDRKTDWKLEWRCRSAGIYICYGKICTVSSWSPQSLLTSTLRAVERSINKLMGSLSKSDFVCVYLKSLPSGIPIKHFISDSISNASSTSESFSLYQKSKDGNIWNKCEVFSVVLWCTMERADVTLSIQICTKGLCLATQ